MSDMLGYALAYAERGWAVFPCKSRAKTPLTTHGCKEATTNLDQIHAWWGRWPQANIGIATGHISNLVVIDVDPEKGGEESLRRLEETHGDLPLTIESLTGGGGRHLFFLSVEIGNSVSKLGEGLDIRGDGGYIVAPPSLHESGKTYEWEVRHHPEEVAIAELPLWVLKQLSEKTASSLPSVEVPIIEGHRNDTLFRLGCSLRANQFSKDAILAALLAENAIRCFPPLEEHEVRNIAEHAGKYKAGKSEGFQKSSPSLTVTPKDDPIEEAPEEEQPSPSYDCPESVWRGPFAQVARILQIKNWEVWMGAACAFGAIANRRIDLRYYGKLHGQFYGLLVKPTGTGKSLVTNTCDALLPEEYWRGGVPSSGPALAPMIATIVRDKKGTTVLSAEPHPTALLIPEWTTLARNMQIQYSTLLEALNEISDGVRWNISRSDSNKGGGGNAILQHPILTICATTTDRLFNDTITRRMWFSGFLNRWFILPGTLTNWEFYNEQAAGINFEALWQLRESLQRTPPFGQGEVIWDLFEEDAKERMIAWGRTIFEPIMNNPEEDAEIYKRLHVTALRLCGIYCWGEQRPRISLDHVETVIPIVETSLAFVRSLTDKSEVYVPPTIKYELDHREKIEKAIRERSGKIDLMKLSQNLRKSMRSQDIRKIVDALVAEKKVTRHEKRWLVWVEK